MKFLTLTPRPPPSGFGRSSTSCATMLDSVSSVCSFDTSVHCASRMVARRAVRRQAENAAALPPARRNLQRRLYVHVCYSRDRATKGRAEAGERPVSSSRGSSGLAGSSPPRAKEGGEVPPLFDRGPRPEAEGGLQRRGLPRGQGSISVSSRLSQ